MAALGSQSIASSYEQLLQVDRDGGGNTTTHVNVKDGDNGTTFGFTIASDALMMTSTNRLEFGDTGTYIHQSADGVLDLVSDTEIELTATTIDMNGALDLSGNAQLSGTVTVGADGSGTDVIFYSGTAGDNFSWDASEEKLTITGTNGQTALDVADGNLVVADNVDIEGDIDVNGTSNLDNTDIDGTLAVDGTTISLDATTSFNIDNSNTSNGITIGTATSGVPISIGHTTSETTVNDNLVVTGDIDLEGSIDVNGTANLDAVDIDGAVQIDNTVTVGADDQGYDVIFYGDTPSSNMTWDTSGDDLILNDATLNIDQDDNVAGIYIDSEATSGIPFQIDSPATTTVNVLTVNNCNALTDGGVAYFHSNSASTNTRNVVDIHNDHASATGATALKITQDANQKAITIDSAATTNHVMRIDGPLTTTGTCLLIDDVDAITTGTIASFLSNSADNSTRNLVQITNDHASADNTVGLLIQQDGADASIELAGNGSIKFPGTQGASADANSLDDYEEGTWTPVLVSGSTTITRSSGTETSKYTKIGNLVTVTWGFANITTAGSFENDATSVTGLPFAVKDTRAIGTAFTIYGSTSFSAVPNITIAALDATALTIYSQAAATYANAEIDAVGSGTYGGFTMTYHTS